MSSRTLPLMKRSSWNGAFGQNSEHSEAWLGFALEDRTGVDSTAKACERKFFIFLILKCTCHWNGLE